MLCIIAACRHAVSVCPSVTYECCVKTNKDIFEIFLSSGSQAIVVFPCQKGWRYSHGKPLRGAWNAGGVGKNVILNEYRCIHCMQNYSVVNRMCGEVWKIKPQRTASSRALTAASGVRRRCSHKTTTKCLWRARRYTPETEVKHPGHNPLAHNSVSCCRRTS